MKNIYIIITLLFLFSCEQENNNIFEDLTDQGGFVQFDETLSIAHDILGENTNVLDIRIKDPNNNAIKYDIAIIKDDESLTETISSVTSFPSNLTVSREAVMTALEITDVSDLPTKINFVGTVTTAEGTYSGLSPEFDIDNNVSIGGNTEQSLLELSPNPMRFSLFMYSLTPANTLASFYISDSDDDAEEVFSTNGQDGYVGEIDLGSSDLEFGELSSGQGLMMVGLRFNFLGIPQGATITSANIQFTADNTGDNPVEITIFGQDTGNSEAFESNSRNLSSRALTQSSVIWNVPEWEDKGDRKEAQKTVDISSVLQEIIDREDWVPGNSISIIMQPSGVSLTADSSSGGREAETFPEDDNGAAELILSYSN